jgi:pimeloyl-ACP methyl ester carboxylesterase
MKAFSEDLFSLLKNLGIQKAIIVGYSMGGMVALRFVLDHPEMVDKIVLISTTASMHLPYWKRMLVPLWTRFQMRKLPANLITPRYVLSSCFSAVANFNVVSELPRIQLQTLIIQAEGEPSLPLNHAECMKDDLPNARLVILKDVVTHLHAISNPEKTWEAIEEFISD